MIDELDKTISKLYDYFHEIDDDELSEHNKQVLEDLGKTIDDIDYILMDLLDIKSQL